MLNRNNILSEHQLLSSSSISTTITSKITMIERKAIMEDSPSNRIKAILSNRKEQQSIIKKSSYQHNIEWEKNYTNEVVNAIRKNDITTLRQMHQSGQSLDGCNRSGETLLHLACRRSNIETIRYMVCEANVTINVTDNMGRTPLHDICWRPRIDSISIFDMIIRVVTPDLILAEDIRGHDCFQYCRKEHWDVWNTLLVDRQDVIVLRAKLYDSINADANSSTQQQEQ